MYGSPPYYPSPLSQSPQQRLQMLESQFPQYSGGGYGNGFPVQSPQAPPLRGRPVSNEEEANAAMIDYDGSLFVFPDNAHGKIYTKQLGMDGNIIFHRYTLEVPANTPKGENTKSPDYPTREEVAGEISELMEYIGNLEKQIAELRGSNK